MGEVIQLRFPFVVTYGYDYDNKLYEYMCMAYNPNHAMQKCEEKHKRQHGRMFIVRAERVTV